MKKLTIFLILSLVVTISINAQDDTQTLDLLFVGDIMGHGPQIKSAYNAETKSYDYNPCFKYVKPIIEEADFAIGNLEVTLSDQGTYTGYPMFRTPDALAYALKNAGFDMLVTSNNHSNDNGAYGVTHTLDVLDNLGYYHTGTFRNQGERDMLYPLIAYKDDFRLAFLNYTYGTNGMPTIAPTLVNEIDEATIKADLEMAEKLQPDAIIVIMHWGAEYQLNESSSQYNLAKKIFEWGADLVIGAHPHVIQPIKKIPYTNKKGESTEGLCVFSMGNFISNQQKYNTDGGLMVEVQLTKKKGTKKAKVGECQYIPVWRYRNRVNEKNSMGTYYALPISAFENENTADLTITKYAKQQMISFGTRMRQHLGKHEGTERKVTLEDLKIGQVTTKNPYATFASYQDSLIVPLENDNYIIYESEEVLINKPKVNKKPTLPAGSTDKTGNSNRTPPKKKITTTTENTTTTTETSPNSTTDKYLVQIQTTRSLYSASLPFDNVIVQEVNGLFRYYLPAGNNLDEARAILTTVQNAGFTDAFVVHNKLKANAKKETENTEKSGDLTIYKIQFQSSTKVAVPKKLPMNEYEILETENGRFRYFAGKADTITEAVEILREIQAAGYKDAFIVKFVNGKPR
ncbi:MAG: CapA family protein [Saprospiraceae bacterium]